MKDSEAQENYSLVSGRYPNSADYDVISKASDGIKNILYTELKRGNRIVETSEGWSEMGVIIWLTSNFQKNYSSEGIEYRDVNDPHYWRNEYRDIATGDTIASKF